MESARISNPLLARFPAPAAPESAVGAARTNKNRRYGRVSESWTMSFGRTVVSRGSHLPALAGHPYPNGIRQSRLGLIRVQPARDG